MFTRAVKDELAIIGKVRDLLSTCCDIVHRHWNRVDIQSFQFT